MFPLYDPRIEMIPSHTKMDPINPNLSFQSWPYGGNFVYPVPPECHGCCHRGGLYGFQPPYPHYPPPPAMFHFPGIYPPFLVAYPPYPVPLPHYSFDQPRYEYDKNARQDHHCCGCPHHSSKQDGKKNAKIEVEKQEPDNKNETLIPCHFRNYPYPIWVPPGYTKNAESEMKEKEKETPRERWKQGEDDEGAESPHTRDDNRFPFPIFWLPYKNMEVESDPKEKASDVKKREPIENDDKSSSEVDSAVIKLIPVKQVETQAENKSPKGNDPVENADYREEVIPSSEKLPSSPKTSVKQVETREENKSPKGNNPVENADYHEEGKPSSRKQPSSPLPPFCLRIDPLPRKKNGNGSSSSPSPNNKRRSNDLATYNAKSPQQQPETSVEQSNSNENPSRGQSQSVTNSHKNVATDAKNKESAKVDEGENAIGEKKEVNAMNEEEIERKKLLENEAAVFIQSACRVFLVRKSQPLMKLRLLAEVQKQVAELRNHIQNLESSSMIAEKQKVILGETIMCLLLKLDTIQGLHPLVRDVKKTVTKELVGLQENLDYLTIKNFENSSEEASSTRPRNALIDSEANDAVQGTVNHAEVTIDGNFEAVESDSSMVDASFGDKAMEPSMAFRTNTSETLEVEAQYESQKESMVSEGEDGRKEEKPENALGESRLEPVETSVESEAAEVEGGGKEEKPKIALAESRFESLENSLDSGKSGTFHVKPMEDVTEVEEVQERGNEAARDEDGAKERKPENNLGDSRLEAFVDSGNSEALHVEPVKKVLEEVQDKENEAAKDEDDQKPKLALVGDSRLQPPEISMESEAFHVEPVKEVHEVQAASAKEEKTEIALVEPRLESQEVLADSRESEAFHVEPVKEFHEMLDVVQSLKDEDDAKEEKPEIVLVEPRLEPSETRTNSTKSEAFHDEPLEEIHEMKDVQQAEAQLKQEDDGKEEKPEITLEDPRLEPLAEPVEEVHEISQVKAVSQTENAVIIKEKESPIDQQKAPPPLLSKGLEVSSGVDKRLVEENARLKEVAERLIKVGDEQLAVISRLSGRVKDLEKKVTRKKKLKMRRCKPRFSSQDELK